MEAFLFDTQHRGEAIEDNCVYVCVCVRTRLYEYIYASMVCLHECAPVDAPVNVYAYLLFQREMRSRH
jgi:hypothetical protein